MREKINSKNIYSGIKIKDNISLTLPKKRSFLDYIPLILIAFCGCVGTANSFVSMFKIDISFVSLNFYTVLFFLIFSAIFINQKSISIPIIPLVMIYELIIFRKSDKFFRGLQLVCNQVYGVIQPKRGDYFRVDISDIDPDSDIKMFIAFSIFLLTAVICCVTIVKPDFFFGFLFTFPLVEIGLYHGLTPDIIPAFMLIVYWASLLALNKSGYYRTAKRNKIGFIRRGNTFYSKPAVKFHSAGQSGIIMLVSSAAIMAAVFILINISGYTRSENLNTMRSNVKTAVTEFSFDDIGGSLERLSASFGLGKLKVYDHRLGNMNSVSYNGRTDLKITVDSSYAPNDNIYLKGYIGSVYDGKSWEELNDDIYKKNSSMLDSFEQSVLYPQDMLYDNYGNEMALITSYDTISEMTIESPLFNNKYFYTPYNSVPDAARGDRSYVNDTIIELKDKNKYIFDVSLYQDFSTLFHYEITDYQSQEYHDFVYENYLDVPNNSDTEKLYNMFIDENIYDYRYQQLQYIKRILADNAEYTLEPGRTPAGRDFVSYFLTENHKGYCVHFATAGIILARMSGIPARYAEGYVLLEDDFNDKNIFNEEYKIDIKDERAHAWAEIYVDNYGWIPYEFTPSAAPALSHSDIIANSVTKPRVTNTQINLSQGSRNTALSSNLNTETTIKPHTTEIKNTFSGTKKTNVKKYLSSLSLEAQLSIASILLLIFIVLIIASIHMIIVKRREKSLNTGSSSKNAINAYNYIIKLLDYCDIKNENMQYLEFAQFAENNEKRIFKSGEFEQITNIALEAAMSMGEISDDRAKKAVIFSYKTAHSVFKKQNVIGRLYMKFIKNLC